jgi:hypothetical protein
VPDGCLASLSPWFLQLVITALYCQIIDIIDGGEVLETCDIATLLATANCYNNLDPFILSRLQASQLCTINQTIPATPPTPPTCQLAITTNPSNYTGDSGTDFTLTVAWTGSLGSATVQWQRDDGGAGWIDVVDGTFDGTTASGSTTPTLTVTHAATFTTGTYRAIVTDPALSSCTATSTTATVTINAAPGNGLLTNLLAYYRFEETSGNALDSSGNGRTLTEHGTILSDPSGIVAKARTYTREDHFYFSNSSSVFNPASAFSVTGWAKFNPEPLAINDFTIAAKGSYPGGTLSWWLLLDHGTPDDHLTLYYTVDGSTLQTLSVTFTGGVNSNLYYFIALRWDGTTLRLSATPQTDSAVATDSTALFAGPFYTSPDPLVVGDMPGSSIHAMDGVIDELSFYNTSLSDCMVGKLFGAKDGSFTYPDFTAGACV